MRDALKNLFSNQIILEDNSQFYYTIKPYELTNALDNVIAVLQEYAFTKEGDDNGQFSCKLYKTKEGNWYDKEEEKPAANNNILRALKLAIDNDGKVKV
ncbi:MAG: hypothetical protein IPI78_02165 [Chitinophagaceae bacterium]|nr:hypothetical protein [Chitinophagaceae bacterium]